MANYIKSCHSQWILLLWTQYMKAPDLIVMKYLQQVQYFTVSVRNYMPSAMAIHQERFLNARTRMTKVYVLWILPNHYNNFLNVAHLEIMTLPFILRQIYLGSRIQITKCWTLGNYDVAISRQIIRFLNSDVLFWFWRNCMPLYRPLQNLIC